MDQRLGIVGDTFAPLVFEYDLWGMGGAILLNFLVRHSYLINPTLARSAPKLGYYFIAYVDGFAILGSKLATHA